jgi:hypothetical protein
MQDHYLQLHNICNIPTARLHCVLRTFCSQKSGNKKAKTYNSGYSPVVTHLTTNTPVHCLSTAERTGSSIFSVLWSYVEERCKCKIHNLIFAFVNSGPRVDTANITSISPCPSASVPDFLRGLVQMNYSIINITTYENRRRDRMSNKNINVYSKEKERC